MGYANGFDSGYDAAIADVKAGRVPGLGAASEGGSAGNSSPGGGSTTPAPSPLAALKIIFAVTENESSDDMAGYYASKNPNATSESHGFLYFGIDWTSGSHYATPDVGPSTDDRYWCNFSAEALDSCMDGLDTALLIVPPVTANEAGTMKFTVVSGSGESVDGSEPAVPDVSVDSTYWATISDHTSGAGYLMLVRRDPTATNGFKLDFIVRTM